MGISFFYGVLMASPLDKLINRTNRKRIASEIITQLKSSRQNLTIDEFGKMLEEAKLEDSAGKSVTDAYMQHDWANIAIHTIARNISRAPFKLYKGQDTEVKKGPLYDVFAHVNPYYSPSQLWEATSAWINCRGEAIWYMVKKDIMPTDIYVLDPTNWVHVLNKKQTEIIQWIYVDPQDGKKVPFNVRDILHFRAWNKWDQWRGRNPLIAQTENIEQDYQANVSNTSLVKNNSVPLGVLSAQQIINEDTAKKLVEQWEAQHKGASKAHKIAVIGHGAKYERIGLMPSEMQYIDMRKWNRNSILARYGIPPILVGVKDDMTPLSGEDTKEQEKRFWTKKLIPDMKFIEDVLKSKFFSVYAPEIYGEFDTSGIEELQTDFSQKMESATKLWNMGYTANEINEKLDLGFEEMPWRDSWWKLNTYEEIAEDYQEQEEEEPNAPFPFFEPQEESKSVPKWYMQYYNESQKAWDVLVAAYRAKLVKWFRGIRDWYMDQYVPLDTERAKAEIYDQTYMEFLFWIEQSKQLGEFTQTFYYRAINQTGVDLKVVFQQTDWNLDFEISEGIPNAKQLVEQRIPIFTKQATSTLQSQMKSLIDKAAQEQWSKQQLADVIRTTWKDYASKAEVIARTELDVIKDTAKQDAYEHEGVEEIEWIHWGGGQEDRWYHLSIDGQRVKVGETFVTGLGTAMRYPHDPAAPVEEVANCRCGTLPAPKERKSATT